MKTNNNEEIISPAEMTWRRLKKNKLAMIGLVILIIIIVFSVLDLLYQNIRRILWIITV